MNSMGKDRVIPEQQKKKDKDKKKKKKKKRLAKGSMKGYSKK